MEDAKLLVLLLRIEGEFEAKKFSMLLVYFCVNIVNDTLSINTTPCRVLETWSK